jgi:hypothetical protein
MNHITITAREESLNLKTGEVEHLPILPFHLTFAPPANKHNDQSSALPCKTMQSTTIFGIQAIQLFRFTFQLGLVYM